ncbi:hypothetical protein [uncultured Tateyamaria sp.]|uniref:hypothetical protein n=1 Tax=uncultured Tateyamaria sp. TaxID=455651 RepID=UPI002623F7E6|nr:hypothetical protein [uncultured Tateyamaria sp.]
MRLNEALGVLPDGPQLSRTWAMGDEGVIDARLEFGRDVTPDAGAFSASRRVSEATMINGPCVSYCPRWWGSAGSSRLGRPVGGSHPGADIVLFDYATILGAMLLLDAPDTAKTDLSPLARGLPRRPPPSSPTMITKQILLAG